MVCGDVYIPFRMIFLRAHLCGKTEFLRFCKSLKIRCRFSRKIQGTYLEISALYFKIYGLYFLQDALCVFALSERVKKQRKIPSKIWLCFSRNGIRTEQCVVCRNASASSEWRSGMPPGNNKTTGRKCLLIRPVVRYCF